MIVDEQHRFGVQQRLRLKRKGEREARTPHQLIMTATPIPRTLAMTAYADLDCSVIDELPPGRQPVLTSVLPESRRSELVERVAAHCATAKQAYWVCPLIDESEAVESSAASALVEELRAALPKARVGLIHGRMRAADKEATMRAFKAAELDLLVATTVIEVGVDVPNASLMIVENAERMGLAQLHQLRGRVGRGTAASHCVLLYKPPLGPLARERLGVLRATTDGFAVAQKDLELRGPGEVLGTRQTGVLQLRVADLVRDADLLPRVIEISDALLESHPERVAPLIRRWSRGAGRVREGLARVANCRPRARAPRIARASRLRSRGAALNESTESEAPARHRRAPRRSHAPCASALRPRRSDCRLGSSRESSRATIPATGASCACTGRSASGCCCSRRCGPSGSRPRASPSSTCS